MLGHAASTRADFLTSLTVDLTPQSGGLTQYEYSLTNEVNSDLPVFQFSLDVAVDADLTLISGPLGWDIIYVAGENQIIWSSVDQSTDLSPGTTTLFAI